MFISGYRWRIERKLGFKVRVSMVMVIFKARITASAYRKHVINLAHPASRKPKVGYMFCCCFLFFFYIFSDFCQTSYLNIHLTDLYEICRDGRNLAVYERSEVIFFRSIKGRCRGSQLRKTTKSAIAALDAGVPINSPINNNSQAARGDSRVGYCQALPCI